MKILTLDFSRAKGMGGYTFLFGYRWCVWTRIYIKGYWTPFCILSTKKPTKQ